MLRELWLPELAIVWLVKSETVIGGELCNCMGITVCKEIYVNMELPMCRRHVF